MFVVLALDFTWCECESKPPRPRGVRQVASTHLAASQWSSDCPGLPSRPSTQIAQNVPELGAMRDTPDCWQRCGGWRQEDVRCSYQLGSIQDCLGLEIVNLCFWGCMVNVMFSWRLTQSREKLTDRRVIAWWGQLLAPASRLAVN